MAQVKASKEKYYSEYALNNVLDYYGYGNRSGTDWKYWTACGVDSSDYEIAKNQMIDTKIKYHHFNGVQLHQVYVSISRDEIKSITGKYSKKVEEELVYKIGQYFYGYGMQTISFVYRNKPGIFVRIVVNSTWDMQISHSLSIHIRI